MLSHVLSSVDREPTHVVEAENGVAGLAELTGDQDFDLILSHVDMEFLDAAVQRSRAQVVVVSDSDHEHLLSEAISRGAKGYVVDPPSADFLRLLVDELDAA